MKLIKGHDKPPSKTRTLLFKTFVLIKVIFKHKDLILNYPRTNYPRSSAMFFSLNNSLFIIEKKTILIFLIHVSHFITEASNR